MKKFLLGLILSLTFITSNISALSSRLFLGPVGGETRNFEIMNKADKTIYVSVINGILPKTDERNNVIVEIPGQGKDKLASIKGFNVDLTTPTLLLVWEGSKPRAKSGYESPFQWKPVTAEKVSSSSTSLFGTLKNAFKQAANKVEKMVEKKVMDKPTYVWDPHDTNLGSETGRLTWAIMLEGGAQPFAYLFPANPSYKKVFLTWGGKEGVHGFAKLRPQKGQLMGISGKSESGNSLSGNIKDEDLSRAVAAVQGGKIGK